MSPLEDQSTVLTLMQPGCCPCALLACVQLAVPYMQSQSPVHNVFRGSSFLGQGFPFVLPEFHKAPLCLFFQPVWVPLDSSPSLGVYQEIPPTLVLVNLLRVLSIISCRSLTKMYKRSGPRVGSCGTQLSLRPNNQFLLSTVIQLGFLSIQLSLQVKLNFWNAAYDQ